MTRANPVRNGQLLGTLSSSERCRAQSARGAGSTAATLARRGDPRCHRAAACSTGRRARSVATACSSSTRTSTCSSRSCGSSVTVRGRRTSGRLSVNCFLGNGLSSTRSKRGGSIGSPSPASLPAQAAVVNRPSSASKRSRRSRAPYGTAPAHGPLHLHRPEHLRRDPGVRRDRAPGMARSVGVGRLGLEPRTTGLTCRTGFHRPPAPPARACGLDHLFTLGGPVRVGGVWPLRALPLGGVAC